MRSPRSSSRSSASLWRRSTSKRAAEGSQASAWSSIPRASRGSASELRDHELAEHDVRVRLRPETHPALRLSVERLRESLRAVEVNRDVLPADLERERVPRLARRRRVADRVEDGAL